MLRDRKNVLTTKILDSIPQNIKPIEYLIRKLEISKESAYRRLRGDIPFTFEEMSKLSLDLNFSMDELIAKPDESRALVTMQTDMDIEPSVAFLKRLKKYSDFLFHLENSSNTETVLTLNHIPLIISVYSKNLFKFLYYKWLHQNNEASFKLNYSDVAIPDEIEELRGKVKLGLTTCINRITLIIDSNFFNALMNEIRYYKKRKLISEEDFKILKSDMIALVNFMENSAQTGFFSPNAKINIYLSSMNIGANAIHIKYNGNEASFIYVFSINPISTTSPTICEKHKKWTDSVKKYSTLITKSNEMLQTEYFDRQREFINSPDDNDFIS